MVRHTDVKTIRCFLITGIFGAIATFSSSPALAQNQARPATAVPPSAVAPPANAVRQYTVRSGDTLDRIIAQTLGNTAFSAPFLRDLFARLNPHALPQGARGVLLAGAVLQVPDACMLRQAAFADTATDCIDRSAQSLPGAAAPLSAQERLERERQHWVRYP